MEAEDTKQTHLRFLAFLSLYSSRDFAKHLFIDVPSKMWGWRFSGRHAQEEDLGRLLTFVKETFEKDISFGSDLSHICGK